MSEYDRRLGEADALYNSGNVEYALGQNSAALRSYSEALAIFRKVNDRKHEAVSLYSSGNVDKDLGRYDAALRSYADALAIYRQVDDRDGEAFDLNNAGIVDKDLGRYDAALRSYAEALAIFRQVKDRNGEALALMNIGAVDELRGYNVAALHLLSGALAIFRQLKDRFDEASALGNIGLVDQNLSRYEDALRSHGDALAIYRDLHNRGFAARALHNLGNVYERLGRYDEALRLLRDAHTMYHQLYDLDGQARSLMDIGIVDMDLGRDDQALRSYGEALGILRPIKDRDGEARDLDNIGIVDHDLGRNEEALRAHRNALVIFRNIKDRDGEAGSLQNIGNDELKLGRYDFALTYAKRSLLLATELGDAEIRWQALDSWGSAAAHLNRRKEALSAFDQSIGQIEQVRTILALASTRATFFQDRLFVYDDYTAYLSVLNQQFPQQGYDRTALGVFERKSARALVEEIGQSATHDFAGVDPQVVADEDAADSAVEAARTVLSKLQSAPNSEAVNLSTAETSLTVATSERAALLAQVKTQYPAYYDLRHPQPIDAAAIQQLLRPSELLLIYDVLDKQSALWVIGHEPGQFELVALPGNAELQKAVDKLHKHLTIIPDSIDRHNSETPDIAERAIESDAAADLNSYPADSFALYQTLLPAVVRSSPLFQEAKSLVIVPSGPLYDLPWEALINQPPVSGVAPHYMLQDYPISYVPSASLLGVVRARQAAHKIAPNPLLAFAHPTAGTLLSTTKLAYARLQEDALRSVVRTARGYTFPDLPGTDAEVDAVRVVLQASPADVHRGDDASKELVLTLNKSGKLKTYQYILFATHAVLPDKIRGLTQPAIVLAHPELGGAFLTMSDILGLSLNADFVALSACDTGAGPHSSGEGVSGLTRAFLYAGTPAISVTLWKVDDQVPPQITPAFFAAMKAGVSPAEALRQAKLAMLQSSQARFRHPSAWATSVIFGDGDTGR